MVVVLCSAWSDPSLPLSGSSATILLRRTALLRIPTDYVCTTLVSTCGGMHADLKDEMKNATNSRDAESLLKVGGPSEVVV